MKRLQLLFLFCITIVGCAPMHMDIADFDDITYTIIKEDDVDFSMTPLFDPTLGDLSKYFFFVDKDLIFRAAAIEYETVLPDNVTKVKASGVIYHPINRKSRGVFDVMPIAHLTSGVSASDVLYSIEGVLAFEGYTIIMPDLIGFGSSSNHPMTFLIAESTGRVSYDMHRAAAKYLWDRFNYLLPVETIIMGYSLGGSSALAAQKYFETHHSQTVKVKEVYASSGVYDMQVAFESFAKSGISEFVAIPNTIYALNHYYNLGLDFDNIFIGTLRDNFEKWLFGPEKLKAQEMIDKLGKEIKYYMHPDFFKSWEEQKGTEFGKLHDAMIENSISRDWKPKAPITITHCVSDTYVPLENAEAAVKSFRNAGANVSFTIYPGTHNTVGYLYFLRMILSFI